MSQFEQIAFFWIGNDIQIPSFLVKSIKLVYGKGFKIFHLTNFSTRRIEGTTKTIRLQLPNDIMLARLTAFRDYPHNKNLTFFCDADSLFIQKLDLNLLNENIYLIKRDVNFMMNHNWPEYYPEFVNKSSMELMPYLFGGMAIRNSKSFFSDLLEKCYLLPDRFHRWYGDQFSLMLLINENKYPISFLPTNTYLKVVRQVVSVNDFDALVRNNTKIITFKGVYTKKFIDKSYDNLVKFYEKQNL